MRKKARARHARLHSVRREPYQCQALRQALRMQRPGGPLSALGEWGRQICPRIQGPAEARSQEFQERTVGSVGGELGSGSLPGGDQFEVRPLRMRKAGGME